MPRTPWAALAAAAFIVLATPAVASAAPAAPSTGASCAGVGGDVYSSAGTVSSSAYTVEPGETVEVTWGAGYFPESVPVQVVTAGPAAAGSTVESSGASAADGSMWAAVTVAPDMAGDLSITGMTEQACGGVTIEVASATPAATDVTADSDSLAYTGSTVPTVLIVAGAGALVFGGILLFARGRLRRRTQE